jgi:hypothetical protein
MVPPPGAIPGRARRGGNVAPPPLGAPVLAKGAYRFMDLYPSKLDASQSTVRVLAATVRDFTRRGVPTIVFMAPLHVQAAKLTGAYTERNLPRAVKVVGAATTENGGAYVDLAEVLPQESYFVDYTHFNADGNRIVRDKLLDEVRRIIGGAPPGRP